jgi:hypothetical protein
MSCQANGGSGPAFEIDKSNWAVEGFWATMDTNGDRFCFGALGTTAGVLWHHVAFINNIASTCDLAGFDTGSTGVSNAGVDQTAMIGGIVYNGANSLGPYGVCGSGISLIPANQNTDAGTHIIVEQNFVYKSTNSPGASQCTAGGGTYPHSDGQGIILDSWGLADYQSQAVIRNNVMWQNGNQGFQVFPQGNGTTNDRAKIYVHNNTSCCNFNDNLIGAGGDLWLHGIYPSGGGFYKVRNNIFLADKHSPANDGNPVTIVTAAVVECRNSDNNCTGHDQTTILVDQNYIWNSYPPTTTGVGGYNTYWNLTWPWGTNTFDDPGLTAPYSLPTAAPDCTGYTDTVSCMNTKYNVYNNIKPTKAPLTMGYQPPTTCAPDPLFPVWLKGIVHLEVRGSQIVQASGLVTRPCGL